MILMDRWGILRIVIIVTVVLIVVNLYQNFIRPHYDCFVPYNVQCQYYRCSNAGLNYSRIAQHEGAAGYDCFCLNGTEEVVR